MIRYALLALLLLVGACNGIGNPSRHGSPPPVAPPAPVASSSSAPPVAGFALAHSGVYTLAVVPPAQPYVGQAALSSPYLAPAVLGIGSASWTLLSVEVHDASTGALANDVQIDFEPTYSSSGAFLGPLGLGSSVSGWGLYGRVNPSPGQASTVFEPYVSGKQWVSASVDPKCGTSNTVVVEVDGQ